MGGDGVSLMTARKAGRRDNSVGAYLCADLESLADQIERTTANLAGFLGKVTAS